LGKGGGGTERKHERELDTTFVIKELYYFRAGRVGGTQEDKKKGSTQGGGGDRAWLKTGVGEHHALRGAIAMIAKRKGAGK